MTIVNRVDIKTHHPQNKSEEIKQQNNSIVLKDPFCAADFDTTIRRAKNEDKKDISSDAKKIKF